MMLEIDSVHIWCADLRLVSPTSKLASALSAEERARASRFNFSKDKHAYLAARAILRDILSRYVDCEAAKIGLNYGFYGKPFLSFHSSNVPIFFNLSHASDLALYAVTRVGEIGIDHERIQAGLAWEDLASQCLAPDEFAAVRRLPQAQQPEAFFRCWTRMEACFKARGWGLAEGIERSRRAQPQISPAGDERSGRSCRFLRPAPEFIGAVAVENPVARWVFWKWQASGADELDSVN